MNEIARNTLIFLAGVGFGGTLGIVLMAICVVGKRADEWGDRMVEKLKAGE